MARREIMVDDLDGTEDSASSVVTREFSVGTEGNTRMYTIDLTDENYARLEAALAPFIDKATPAGGSTSSGTASKGNVKFSGSTSDPKAVRDWAKQNGHKVSDRGRVSKTVTDAYRDRNKGGKVKVSA